MLARALLDRVSAALCATAPQAGPEAVDLWPCVFAAVLDPLVLGGFDDALVYDDLATLVALAQLLPQPAATVCEDLRDLVLAR